jgi:transcriptional regulator with XRE-family HTH domain
MPGDRQTPTVRLRRLAAELRSLRTSSGLTRDEIVERTGINVATLYRIEHARVRPQTRTLRTLLDLYGVEEAHQGELTALLRDARQRGWLHAYQSVLPEQYTTYIGFEGEARGVWNYESLFVPGLLQTEDYARAVIRGGYPSASHDEVERRVRVRMERQNVLRGESPLELLGDRRRGRAAAPGRRPGRDVRPAPVPAGRRPASPGDVAGHPVRRRRSRGHARFLRVHAVHGGDHRGCRLSTAWPASFSWRKAATSAAIDLCSSIYAQ